MNPSRPSLVPLPRALSEGVRYAIGPTPLGPALAATTGLGLAAFLFLDGEADGEATALERVRRLVPGIEPAADDRAALGTIEALAAWLEDGPSPVDVELDLRGTPFQVRVWKALRAVAPGETITYGELAARLGNAGSARAVGAACGANPIGFWVPCHRAVGAGGALVKYRWGLDRKRALLDRERGSGMLLGLTPPPSTDRAGP